MKEKILESLQALRGTEAEGLAAAEFAAERSMEMIQAFCNIDGVPEGLLGVAVSLAGWILDGGMGAAQTGGSVTSIKEGDISIGFAQGGMRANASEGEMLRHFLPELERFRRLPG